jgi:hypothetical protein
MMQKSSVDLLKSKEHLKIDYDDSTGYVIEFRLNTGKGTSPIRIPVEFMEQIIDVLEVGPEIVEEKNIVDTVRNSLAYDLDENGEEVVVFRTRYGRGSKIHKIRKNEYEQVIGILKEINGDIPEVISKYEDLSF